MRTEYPPQMGQAHTAETNSPAVPRKPAELIRGRSGIPAPGDSFKTTDLKDDPVGVGKGVLLGTLNHNSLNRPGNRLAALAADYIFLLFR